MGETYIVWFENAARAQYWRIEFVNKFAKDVIRVNQYTSRVDLGDSTWYFMPESQRNHMIGVKGSELTEEDLYIILDDKERTFLDSYEGDRKEATDERSIKNR